MRDQEHAFAIGFGHLACRVLVCLFVPALLLSFSLRLPPAPDSGRTEHLVPSGLRYRQLARRSALATIDLEPAHVFHAILQAPPISGIILLGIYVPNINTNVDFICKIHKANLINRPWKMTEIKMPISADFRNQVNQAPSSAQNAHPVRCTSTIDGIR